MINRYIQYQTDTDSHKGVDFTGSSDNWYPNTDLIFTILNSCRASLRPHGLQHARPSCPSPTPGACSNSCPLSWWCHATISSSVTLFSCLQSFPVSGSFAMSQFFTSGGKSIGAPAWALVLPANIQENRKRKQRIATFNSNTHPSRPQTLWLLHYHGRVGGARRKVGG